MTAQMKASIYGMLDTMAAFSALLERETSALGEADFKAVDALQQDKRDLARRYADDVTVLCKMRENAASLDSATRTLLAERRTDFTQLLSRNLRALETAKGSTRRLIDRILDAAQKTAIDSRQTHYSAKGQTGSWKTATMSLSMDQRL